MKLWVFMNQRAGLLKKNSEVMAAVLSQFEGPKAGHWAQVKLEYYMGPNCQVQVYSGRGSSQVWTKADEGQGQGAGQGVSPAGVGDRLDSTTKDNEH